MNKADPSQVRYLVGAEIKRRRKEKLWSMEYLASRSGIHATALGRVEQGQREPRLKTIAQIADGLGVPLSDLLKTRNER